MFILLACDRFVPGRTLGGERYLAGLLEGLSSLSPDVRTVFLGSENACQWVEERFPTIERRATTDRRILGASNAALAWALGGRSVRTAAKRGPDIVFFPFNLVPRGIQSPVGLMVHDLADRYYVKHLPRNRSMAIRVRRRIVDRSIRRADIVITPSKSVADEVTSGAVKPISPIVLHEAFGLLSEPPLQPAGVPSDWIIFEPGSAQPHKGHEVTIAALQLLRNARSDIYKRSHLVLTAGRDGVIHRLQNLAFQMGVADRVTFLGHISDPELLWLYQNCRLVTCPSLYEGFGLPLLEAQFAGAPVLASDIPVFREISGGHASFFRPGSAAAMAAELPSALENEALRARLIPAAKAHARERTWSTYAEDLVHLLAVAIERHPPDFGVRHE